MSCRDQNVTLVYYATSHLMDCIIHVVDVRVEKLGMVLIANLIIARQIHVFPELNVIIYEKGTVLQLIISNPGYITLVVKNAMTLEACQKQRSHLAM